jgi:hypothetical protein
MQATFRLRLATFSETIASFVYYKLEAQQTEPVSLAFHFVLRNLFMQNLSYILPTKCRFLWTSGFREDLLEVDQSETRIACGGHVCKLIGPK